MKKKRADKYFSFSNGKHREKGKSYDNKIVNYNIFNSNYLIKRIMRELIAASIILIIFFTMKYVPNGQVKNIYIASKEILYESFDYNKYVERFGYIKLGNLKIEDINKEKIEAKLSQLKIYIENISNSKLNNGI